MKNWRILLTLVAMSVALFACGNSSDDTGKTESNVPYQIRLEANGKRVWAEGDQVHVYHRLSGDGDFIDDGAFTLEGTSGNKFGGILKTGLADGKKYDWKVIYPYTSDGKVSIGTDYMVQEGYSAKTHILNASDLPLQGNLSTGNSGSDLKIEMKDGFVTAEVKIKNDGMYDVPISSVKLGQVTVIVNNAESVPVGESAIVYVPVSESDAKGKCALSVNGSASSVEMDAAAGSTVTVDCSYKVHNTNIVDAKVYSGSRYSTFTSIARYGSKLYIAFRESDTQYCHHSAADMKEKGYVVICSSYDGLKWNKEITLVNDKYDCHDPKLVVSTDGSKLLVYHGITTPGDGSMKDPCSGVWTLETDESGKLDEKSYSTVDMGSKSCYWLWGFTKHDDYYYGVGYFYYDRGKPTLFRSKDGIKYEEVSEFETEGNEASPCFVGDRLYVFFRSVQTLDCFVTWADAPYTDWHTKTYGFTMHSPHAVELWGKIYVAMRYNMYSNSICCYDPATEGFECIYTTFTNSASTDVGYPGMIVNNGALAVSWYAAEKYLDPSPDIYFQSIGLGKIYNLSF